jgi:hypothetical protein
MSNPLNVEAARSPGVFSGTELIRPFLPSQDFELSKSFYDAVGFEKVLDSEVAIFRAGSGGFILQRHYHKEWAAHCMMQLMVDDLDAWWTHISSLDLPGRFGVQPPKAPAVQPRGASGRIPHRSLWSVVACGATAPWRGTGLGKAPAETIRPGCAL